MTADYPALIIEVMFFLASLLYLLKIHAQQNRQANIEISRTAISAESILCSHVCLLSYFYSAEPSIIAITTAMIEAVIRRAQTA